MSDTEYIVEVKNYSKIIDENTVLDNINLNLEAQKIYGFYGPNGSGKTMLFRAICGLIHPSSGEVYVEGKKIGEEISFPESLGLIISNVGFWDEYSGYENLEIIADIKKIASREDIKEAMRRVGLDPESKKLYGKYSLGMKQRLAIAQAIMEKPRLLILDEPTNALDFSGVEEIRELIAAERARGATVLISSHNQQDLEELCDEFYRFSYGGKLEKTSSIENTKSELRG